MITATEPAQRLVQAKAIYENTYDHYERHGYFREVEEDLRYRHGRQWSAADLKILHEQRRPALVFNLVAARCRHLCGAHEDNLEEPVAVPVGPEDRLQAELLNHLRDRIYGELEATDLEAEAFEQGIEAGIHSISVDALPHPDDPEQIEVVFHPHGPWDVMWDPASERRDRRDARFNFVCRWLSRSEFKAEFPEHAGVVDEVFNSFSGAGPTIPRDNAPQAPSARGDAYRHRRELLYYDRHRDQVRLIRIEFKYSERVTVAKDPVTGEAIEVEDAEHLRLLRAVAREGELAVESYWRESYRWLQFIGDKILYDDEQPIPLDEWSLASFICHLDEHQLPYGVIRAARDPQDEVNKRYSQTLHLMTQQTQPGSYAEEWAVVDKTQFEKAQKMAGSAAYLRRGGLGAIRERQVPTFPDGAAQLHQGALRLLDIIMGVTADEIMEPRGIPEAAATAQLKHRQSLLMMRPILRAFGTFQRQLFRKLVKIITLSMPDAQIAALLGNSERFQVQDGMVMDRTTQKVAPLRSIRDVRYQIDVRPAEENSTERMIGLQLALQLLQLQVPFPPDVLVDLLPYPAEMRDRIRAFARQQQEMQARSSQAEMEAAMEQLAKQYGLEKADRAIAASKVDEAKRHNLALEAIQTMKVTGGQTLDLQRLSLDQKQQVLDFALELLGQTNPPASAGA